jgi:TolB-like protein/DNA-binding winged helix-turn-helix (wHTH) protein/Flp pilus assembly protein TadD
MQTPDPSETFRFGDFELDTGAYELRRHGRPVPIERQPMDLLLLLVERRRQLVQRSEIIDRLWGKDVFVDVETGVHTAIRQVRRALRDSPDNPAFVETVPGKGYRFIAAVDVVRALPPVVAPLSGSSEPESEPAGASTPGVGEAPVGIDGAGLGIPSEPARFSPVATPTEPAVRAPAASAAGMRLAVGVALAVLLLGAGIWTMLPPGTDSPAVPLTLAVLPFTQLSGNPAHDYVAAGLAEDTATSLGQIDPGQMVVVAGSSTMGYQGSAKSAAEIGRELAVDYIVESSLRVEDRRLRVTATLVRVRDQVQVWSQSYDREPTSVLSLQRELSTAIAEQIRLRLSPGRRATLEGRQTQSPAAYDLYLRGRNFENQRTPATLRQAIEYYSRATERDPDYALAWAAIARVLGASLFNSDTSVTDVLPRYREAAQRAVRTDPDLPEAHSALAYLKLCCDWDWPAAEAGLRRALTLDPRSAISSLTLAHTLSQMGRHDEALLAARRARELDPLSPFMPALSSQVAFQARDYDEALEQARQAIVLDQEFWIGHMARGQALEQLGDHESALEALTTAARFSGQNSKALSLRAYILAKLGRTEDARAMLRTLESIAQANYVPPVRDGADPCRPGRA